MDQWHKQLAKPSWLLLQGFLVRCGLSFILAFFLNIVFNLAFIPLQFRLRNNNSRF